jgi:hypothetical protein
MGELGEVRTMYELEEVWLMRMNDELMEMRQWVNPRKTN